MRWRRIDLKRVIAETFVGADAGERAESSLRTRSNSATFSLDGGRGRTSAGNNSDGAVEGRNL